MLPVGVLLLVRNINGAEVGLNCISLCCVWQILQKSSPRYFPLSPFASFDAMVWWNVQAGLSIILIEIKKAMMNV